MAGWQAHRARAVRRLPGVRDLQSGGTLLLPLAARQRRGADLEANCQPPAGGGPWRGAADSLARPWLWWHRADNITGDRNVLGADPDRLGQPRRPRRSGLDWPLGHCIRHWRRPVLATDWTYPGRAVAHSGPYALIGAARRSVPRTARRCYEFDLVIQ